LKVKKAATVSPDKMYTRTPLIQLQRSLAAQAGVKKAAEGAPALQTKKLENGLLVAGIDTGAKLTSVGVLTKAGSRYETYDTLGVSHTLRAAFGLASDRYTGFGMTRHIQQAGANVAVAGSRDYIMYSTHFLRDAKHEHVLDYMFEGIANPKFRHWEVPAAYKKVAVQTAEIDPSAKAIELLHKAAYRNGGLGNSIYCPDHMVGKNRCVDLAAFHAKHVTGGRTMLVGINTEWASLLEYAKSLELEASAGPSAPVSTYYGGEERCGKTGPLAWVAIAAESGNPMASLKEAAANYILKIILGDGQKIKYGALSGKLPKTLASDGLHAVSGFHTGYEGTSLLGAFITTDAATAGENVSKVAAALRSVVVSDAEFQVAKKQFALEMSERSMNPADNLEMIGSALFSDDDLTNFDAAADLVNSLTLADVQAAAKKLSNAKLSMGACGNVAHVPYADSL